MRDWVSAAAAELPFFIKDTVIGDTVEAKIMK